MSNWSSYYCVILNGRYVLLIYLTISCVNRCINLQAMDVAVPPFHFNSTCLCHVFFACHYYEAWCVGNEMAIIHQTSDCFFTDRGIIITSVPHRVSTGSWFCFSTLQMISHNTNTWYPSNFFCFSQQMNNPYSCFLVQYTSDTNVQ